MGWTLRGFEGTFTAKVDRHSALVLMLDGLDSRIVNLLVRRIGAMLHLSPSSGVVLFHHHFVEILPEDMLEQDVTGAYGLVGKPHGVLIALWIDPERGVSVGSKLVNVHWLWFTYLPLSI